MRILIGAGNYPKLSESYIEAEIKYLLRRGHEVAVYSPVCGSPEAPELVTVYRDAGSALRDHRPEVFHAHYLTFDWNVMEAASRARIPITVRGHSFDFSVNVAMNLASRWAIKRIWLFPHFASMVSHKKVFPLPVAYDSELYVSGEKEPLTVYRTGAGKHGKGLEDFFQVSRMCPDFKFSMSANVVLGEEGYMDVLRGLAKDSPVDLVCNIGRNDAAARMGLASIYLDTSDPSSHAFGMPISIAEAMATGAYVLARKNASSEAYLGGAGAMYGSAEEAAAIIRSTRAWTPETWAGKRDAAIKRASCFSDHAVLPAETEFWKTLA